MQNIGFDQAKQKRSQISHFIKITERIEYCKMLEVNDDEEAIHLLINLIYTVIVSDNGSPILASTYSTILVFYETNVRYYQYKT